MEWGVDIAIHMQYRRLCPPLIDRFPPTYKNSDSKIDANGSAHQDFVLVVWFCLEMSEFLKYMKDFILVAQIVWFNKLSDVLNSFTYLLSVMIKYDGIFLSLWSFNCHNLSSLVLCPKPVLLGFHIPSGVSLPKAPQQHKRRCGAGVGGAGPDKNIFS